MTVHLAEGVCFGSSKAADREKLIEQQSTDMGLRSAGVLLMRVCVHDGDNTG